MRAHNHLLDPTRLVHRRVYEAVGDYDPDYTLAQDFHFWLRAAPRFRFRHVDGEPLIRLRRHGENFSDESMRALEIDEVEAALGRRSSASRCERWCRRSTGRCCRPPTPSARR